MWKKIFLILMLAENWREIMDVMLAIKNFSLTKLSMLLNVKCNCFRGTKIFHCLRNFKAHFLAKAEVMVDGMTAGKNHRGKICKIDPFLPELLYRNSFHVKERNKINLQIVAL